MNSGTSWYLRNEFKQVIDFRAVGWILQEPFFFISFIRQDEIFDFSRGFFLRGI